MTPEQFTEIGRALYGDQYQGQLADALGVSVKSVYRWSHGLRCVPAGVSSDLARIARERGKAIAGLAERLV